MMKVLAIIFLSLSLIGMSGCSETKENVQETKINTAKVVSETILVDGMTCESCENNIQTTISKVNGVVSVKASHVEKTTVVEFDSSQVSVKELKNEISEMGYKVMDQNAVAAKTIPETKNVPQMKCGAGKCGAAMMGNE